MKQANRGTWRAAVWRGDGLRGHRPARRLGINVGALPHLDDPMYASFCDDQLDAEIVTTLIRAALARLAVSLSPLLGLLFFAGVLTLVALCSQSASARQHLAGYVFAASDVGLAVVLYLAYASYFILQVVCLPLCRHVCRGHCLFLFPGRPPRFP
jgi:uncharacterized membrane protein